MPEADAPEAVARWVETRFGGPVTMVEPPVIAGDGFDTAIHLVRFSGRSLPPEWIKPLVLRVHPIAARLELAEREAAIQGFLADSGYPAPRVLEVLPPGAALELPVQVMERVPGTNGLAAIEAKPWRAPRLMTSFGALHARLHSLPTAGWPEAAGTQSLAERRLRLPHRVLDERSLPAAELDQIGRALARVERLLPALDVDEPVVCHGDFHPMNVMVDGEAASVIDWTDACLGDPVGDVARFLDVLKLGAAGAPERLQRLVLKAAGPPLGRRYLRAYEKAAGRRIDPARLRQWQPVHVLHDWVRAAITVAEQGDGPPRAHPGVVDWLRHRFDRVAPT